MSPVFGIKAKRKGHVSGQGRILPPPYLESRQSGHSGFYRRQRVVTRCSARGPSFAIAMAGGRAHSAKSLSLGSFTALTGLPNLRKDVRVQEEYHFRAGRSIGPID